MEAALARVDNMSLDELKKLVKRRLLQRQRKSTRGEKER